MSLDGLARGPIQMTEGNRKILQDFKGELKDHHIELTVDESRTPVTNIVAGVRWLFYKKQYGERTLKRNISWDEAAIFYKGLSKQLENGEESQKIMKTLYELHESLKRQRK